MANCRLGRGPPLLSTASGPASRKDLSLPVHGAHAADAPPYAAHLPPCLVDAVDKDPLALPLACAAPASSLPPLAPPPFPLWRVRPSRSRSTRRRRRGHRAPRATPPCPGAARLPPPPIPAAHRHREPSKRRHRVIFHLGSGEIDGEVPALRTFPEPAAPPA